MANSIVINPDNIVYRKEDPVIGTDEIRTTDEVLNTATFLHQLSDLSYSDSGLMPPTVRMLRTGMNYKMVVHVLEPAVRTMFMSNNERGSTERFEVAMPYVILLVMYYRGNMQATRAFYSPTPITSLNDPLYHTNWPNTNTLGGFRNQAVGAMCLHLDQNESKKTQEEAHKILLERVEAGEPFNQNFSNIDGLACYESAVETLKTKKDLSFLYDLRKWEAKTKKDGIDWVRDDYWIPIKVKSIDSQLGHDPAGVQLTLGMAVYGDAPFYVSEPAKKFMNDMARGRVEEDLSADFYQLLRGMTVQKTTTSKAPQVPENNFAGEADTNLWVDLTTIKERPRYVRKLDVKQYEKLTSPKPEPEVNKVTVKAQVKVAKKAPAKKAPAKKAPTAKAAF